MKNIRIVLDTSIFVNPQSRHFFGKTPGQALETFLDQLEVKKNLRCYFPPSVYEELMKFMEKIPPARKLLLIKKRPPSSYQSSIPAILLYEFIEEMRLRMNKGLRIAEKYTRKSLKTDSPDRGTEEEMIKPLRQEYRVALREGVIDSKEDFDLVLLAKELGAYLATADKGLIHWAQKLGISCLDPKELKEMVST